MRNIVNKFSAQGIGVNCRVWLESIVKMDVGDKVLILLLLFDFEYQAK